MSNDAAPKSDDRFEQAVESARTAPDSGGATASAKPAAPASQAAEIDPKAMALIEAGRIGELDFATVSKIAAATGLSLEDLAAHGETKRAAQAQAAAPSQSQSTPPSQAKAPAGGRAPNSSSPMAANGGSAAETATPQANATQAFSSPKPDAAQNNTPESNTASATSSQPSQAQANSSPANTAQAVSAPEVPRAQVQAQEIARENGDGDAAEKADKPDAEHAVNRDAQRHENQGASRQIEHRGGGNDENPPSKQANDGADSSQPNAQARTDAQDIEVNDGAPAGGDRSLEAFMQRVERLEEFERRLEAMLPATDATNDEHLHEVGDAKLRSQPGLDRVFADDRTQQPPSLESRLEKIEAALGMSETARLSEPAFDEQENEFRRLSIRDALELVYARIGPDFLRTSLSIDEATPLTDQIQRLRQALAATQQQLQTAQSSGDQQSGAQRANHGQDSAQRSPGQDRADQSQAHEQPSQSQGADRSRQSVAPDESDKRLQNLLRMQEEGAANARRRQESAAQQQTQQGDPQQTQQGDHQQSQQGDQQNIQQSDRPLVESGAQQQQSAPPVAQAAESPDEIAETFTKQSSSGDKEDTDTVAESNAAPAPMSVENT